MFAIGCWSNVREGLGVVCLLPVMLMLAKKLPVDPRVVLTSVPFNAAAAVAGILLLVRSSRD